MNFIPPDSRERHAYVDAVVAETQHNLTANAEVGDRLPRFVIEAALDSLATYFVPNYDDGTLSIPDSKLDTEDLPITVLRQGETAVLGKGFGTMTPHQSVQLETRVASWGLSEAQRNNFLDVVRAGLMDVEYGLNLDDFRKTRTQIKLASVTRLLIDLDVDEVALGVPAQDAAMLIPGRSLVSFHVDGRAELVPRFADSASMLHELVHIRQIADDPFENVQDEDIRLAHELEAYYYGELFEAALFDSDDPRYEGNPMIFTAYPVEFLRRKYQQDPDNPFRPTDELKKALVKQSLRII